MQNNQISGLLLLLSSSGLLMLSGHSDLAMKAESSKLWGPLILCLLAPSPRNMPFCSLYIIMMSLQFFSKHSHCSTYKWADFWPIMGLMNCTWRTRVSAWAGALQVANDYTDRDILDEFGCWTITKVVLCWFVTFSCAASRWPSFVIWISVGLLGLSVLQEVCGQNQHNSLQSR